MKKITTEKFKAINKEATVGTRGKVSKSGSIRKAVTIKPAKSKPRRCSGCSRKRKRG
jgi:hypothetical protein